MEYQTTGDSGYLTADIWRSQLEISTMWPMLRVPLKQACDSNDSVYRTSYLTTRRWRDPQIPLRRILGMQYAQGILSLSRDVTSCGESVTQSGKKQDQVGTRCCTPSELSGFRGFQQGLANPKMPMVLASAEPVCRSPSRSGLGRSSGRTKLAPSDAASDAAYLTSCPMQLLLLP